MSKPNKRTPIVFYVGIVLACLTLVSIYMTSGMYARYMSRASGSDSARVAKFQVDDTLTVKDSEGNTVSSILVRDVLIPGESTTYTFDVTNNSEVTVVFRVSGKSILGEHPDLPLQMTPVAELLEPGKSGQVVFKIAWDNTKLDVEYGDMLDMIEITVDVEQIN